MKPLSVHFIYDECNKPVAAFADELIAAFKQVELVAAKMIVTIGGDGTLLHALHHAAGKKIIGLVPPGSNSRGFWTNHKVKDAADFAEALKNAKAYPIKPLRADIEFADGSTETRLAYNDVSIRPVHQESTDWLKEHYKLAENEVSIQSALLNLRVAFADAVLGPHRIMGGGLVFATPLGSTAMNRTYGGPSIDIRNNVIVLTGIGISEPSKGFNSVVNSGDTVFDVEVASLNKRPVIVSYDSFGQTHGKSGSVISKVKISMSSTGMTRLVLTDDPGTRAYSAMTP